MYAAGTILTLKDPRDPDPETNEAFAYNTVEVVGESPVSHAHKGDWQGADAVGVILTPKSNFGGTIDYPFGRLRQLYDVESIPEVVTNIQAPVRVIDTSTAAAGETPEEVFQSKAPGVAPEEGQTRGRTPHFDPLGAPGGPEGFDGPLGVLDADPATLRQNAEAKVSDALVVATEVERV